MKTTIFHVIVTHITAFKKHLVSDVFRATHSSFDSLFLTLSRAIKGFLGPSSVDKKKLKK